MSASKELAGGRGWGAGPGVSREQGPIMSAEGAACGRVAPLAGS